MAKELTAKQRLFVAEYLTDLNATRAAIAAGYSEKTANEQGSRLLANVKVSAEIGRQTDKRLKKLDISAEYVLQGIRETIERCRQSAPVLDRKGKPVYAETEDGDEAVAYTFQALPALKGYELLGKHLKLFTDRAELTGPNGGPIAFQLERIED
jgi:phage terminase small subunit